MREMRGASFSSATRDSSAVSLYLATCPPQKYQAPPAAWYTFSVRNLRKTLQGLSPIAVTALLSVMLLVGVSLWRVVSIAVAKAMATSYTAEPLARGGDPDVDINWQQEMMLLGLDVGETHGVASTTDHLAMIGPQVLAQLIGGYSGLQEDGIYDPAKAEKLAESVSRNLRATVPSKAYTLAELKTDSDTSHERMLSYRADLRTSLAPLLLNTRNELELYAKYMETSDEQYLEELRGAAEKYREAAKLTAQVVVPHDAVNYHIAILNAMQGFSVVLDEMAERVDDPFASAALLRTYNDAESDMLFSFDKLASYYGQKKP